MFNSPAIIHSTIDQHLKPDYSVNLLNFEPQIEMYTF